MVVDVVVVVLDVLVVDVAAVVVLMLAASVVDGPTVVGGAAVGGDTPEVAVAVVVGPLVDAAVSVATDASEPRRHAVTDVRATTPTTSAPQDRPDIGRVCQRVRLPSSRRSSFSAAGFEPVISVGEQSLGLAGAP